MKDERLKEGRERVGKLLSEGMRLALKLTPLWVEAIWAGAIISAVVEKNKKLKLRLPELDGKVFLFEAKDIEKAFYLRIVDGGIKVIPHIKEAPDVVMKGEVQVLTDVFLGRVDPDTVFFSRRLEITGDTATAILFKNILAATFG